MKYLFLAFIAFCSALSADFGVKTRGELHGKYQNLLSDFEDLIFYARLDKAFVFPSEWEIYLRLDLPYIILWGNQKEVIEIDDEGTVVEFPAKRKIVRKYPMKEQGFADLPTKVFFVAPSRGEMTLGFGSEFTFPTAQEFEIGTGKYSACPMVGIKYNFPDVASGASLAFFAKYQFSFAGDKDRPSYRIFFIQPAFSVNLSKTWVLSMSPETQYNCITDQWFVPMSIALAKVLGRTALSFQYQRGLITDFPVFQDEVELTFSCLF